MLIRQTRYELITVLDQQFVRLILVVWTAVAGLSSWSNLNQDAPLAGPLLREVVVGPTANLGVPLASVVGVVILGQEYRNGCLPSRLAGQASRTAVFISKGVIATLLAISIAAIGFLAGVAAIVWSKGVVENGAWAEVASKAIWAVLTVSCFSLLGVALASLLKSEVAAAVLLVSWLGIAEPLVSRALRQASGSFDERTILPGEAALSLTRDGAGTLSWNITVTAVWLLVIGALGGLAFVQRDVGLE